MNAETEQNIHHLFNGVQNLLTGKEHFTCVYGSVITQKNRLDSDIDFFVSSEQFESADRISLAGFAVSFHRELGFDIDEEVPYTNKVSIPYAELFSSAKLGGLAIENGRIKVPHVVKNDEFLSSREIRLRLVFNALTVPHQISEQQSAYAYAKIKAEESLFYLAVDLADQRGLDPMKTDNLIASLLNDGQGNEGEMYLGYKLYEPVVQHLEQILKRQMARYTTSSALLVQAVLLSINAM